MEDPDALGMRWTLLQAEAAGAAWNNATEQLGTKVLLPARDSVDPVLADLARNASSQVLNSSKVALGRAQLRGAVTQGPLCVISVSSTGTVSYSADFCGYPYSVVYNTCLSQDHCLKLVEGYAVFCYDAGTQYCAASHNPSDILFVADRSCATPVPVAAGGGQGCSCCSQCPPSTGASSGCWCNSQGCGCGYTPR